MSDAVMIVLALALLAALLFGARLRDQTLETLRAGGGSEASHGAEVEEAKSDGLPPEQARNLALLIVGVPVVALMIYKSIPAIEDDALVACENALKARLKAPSTYQRISASGGPDYFITYDAQNSFGVPLRGSGSCRYHGGYSADWTEYPTAADFPIQGGTM